MKAKKTMVFLGTRPEVIKLAPVIFALQKEPTLSTQIISTGQHKEMLQQALGDFDLSVDHSLEVMIHDQSLAGLSSRLFASIGALLHKENPDMVIVQGDTSTVMVAALCAFYQQIPCAHIEAGLRTYNLNAPFPEELNRRITTLTSVLHFAPTQQAVDALLAEGVRSENVFLTGNTVIDALLWTADRISNETPFITEEINALMQRKAQYILMTCHRRENIGRELEQVCEAVKQLIKKIPSIHIILPVHKNPRVRDVIIKELSALERVQLVEPLHYRQFVYLMKHAWCILTDSGGIQEEAPSLNKPVLVLRDVTERPEGVAAGCARMVGTNTDAIVSAVEELHKCPVTYVSMAEAKSPYGDGQAAAKIVSSIKDFFQGR